MRIEHKIIMSTYYGSSNTDPSRLDKEDYMYSVSMDVEQMLFMMGGVFGQVEYKYRIGNECTNIVPVEERQEEYNQLVDYSNEEFIKNGILAVNKEGKEGFSAQDYNDIEKYKNSDMAKAKLHFLNVLTNRFNSTGMVGERENVICYCMFNYQSGREFIGYLLAMLLHLLIACRDEKNEKAENVINSLNNDYVSMQQCFDNADEILVQLRNRDKIIQDNYEKSFIINSSRELIDWISKHQKIIEEKDILKFIFWGKKEYGYKANMSFANNLLWHIVQISRLILNKERGSIKWEKELKRRDELPEFQCLNCLIKELEESSASPSFDKIGWIDRYITGLSMVADEKRTRLAG